MQVLKPKIAKKLVRKKWRIGVLHYYNRNRDGRFPSFQQNAIYLILKIARKDTRCIFSLNTSFRKKIAPLHLKINLCHRLTLQILSHQGAQLMNRFIELLERGEYRTHRDIAYYADKLCVTAKYLSETCKSISGCGAAYWINRYTAVEIARLLRDRSLTLSDIAFRFDFSSTAYLSRYIRQHLGVSASEIRGGEK